MCLARRCPGLLVLLVVLPLPSHCVSVLDDGLVSKKCRDVTLGARTSRMNGREPFLPHETAESSPELTHNKNTVHLSSHGSHASTVDRSTMACHPPK